MKDLLQIDKYLKKAVETADSEIKLLKEKKVFDNRYFWIYNEHFYACYKKIGLFVSDLKASISRRTISKTLSKLGLSIISEQTLTHRIKMLVRDGKIKHAHNYKPRRLEIINQ